MTFGVGERLESQLPTIHWQCPLTVLALKRTRQNLQPRIINVDVQAIIDDERSGTCWAPKLEQKSTIKTRERRLKLGRER